jgi:hypothetical protein
MTSLDRVTRVALTTEEASPGVPLWGPNQVMMTIPSGETSVALENLIAGRTYYVRTWNEDTFGNKSPYRDNVIHTPPDATIPAKPTGLTLTAGDNGFQATWSPVADTDLAEYDFAYADDDGTGTGPVNNVVYTVVSTRATQFWVDQAHAQKTWCKVRSRDFSGNASDYSALVATTPVRTVPMTVSANGYLDSGSPMRAFIKVPAGVTDVQEAVVTLAFREFMAPATAATATATLTSVSSGTLTSASGGGSTSGSSSAASATTAGFPYTFATMGHAHGGGAAATWTNPASSVAIIDIPTSDHTHPIPHTHSTPDHTHDVAGHTHDIAGHAHALTYGTYEEAYPGSHSVKLKVYESVAGAWALLHTSTSQTDDLVTLDLATWIDGPGDYRIEVLSDAGQPQGGRLGLDLFGTLTVVV